MASDSDTEKVLLSLRAYARHRGVALNAVQRAIKSNRIRVEIVEGKKKINRDEADALWAQNTNHAKVSHAHISQKTEAQEDLFKTQDLAPELDDTRSQPTGKILDAALEELEKELGEDFDVGSEDDVGPIHASVRKERHYKALLEKMKFEKLRGQLIEVEKVEAKFFKMARVTRDSILNIPNRVAGEVAAEKDPHKVHQILTRAIVEALEQLSNSKPLD